MIYDQTFNIMFQQKVESIQFQQKMETIQYKAALEITGAIRGSSKESLYHELGLETL